MHRQLVLCLLLPLRALHAAKVQVNAENMVDWSNCEQFPMHYSQDFGESIDAKFDADKLDSKAKITSDFQKLLFFSPFQPKSVLTVRSRMQNGNEKCELESFVYTTVSFSTPKMIASSNSIAKG